MTRFVVLIVWWIGIMVVASRSQDMPPIDRDLWQAMQQAFANISMPLAAHQQIQQIMQGVERQAAQRKAASAAQQKEPLK